MEWGNGVSPSAPKDKGVESTLCPVLPCHQSRDPSAGLQGVPSPGFLLFPCVGCDPVDNRTLFMTVFVFFLIVNGEIVCRSLLHRDVSSIQPRASLALSDVFRCY